MAVGRLVHYDNDGRMRQLLDWCLYAAFTSPGEGRTLVKVGMSQSPMKRIYAVHCGSAFPVEQAVWTHVGSRKQARSIEKSVAARLAPFLTRGEWYEFDMLNPTHKEMFHATMKVCFMRATGRKLEWRKLMMDEVREAAGVNFDKLTTMRRAS